MNTSRSMIAVALAASLLTISGCSDHRHARQGPPPPPPMGGQDRVARIARENGFRDGRAEGRADAEHRRPYDPQHSRLYKDYPGWVPEMGSRGVYRDLYQAAFVQGYQEAYGHRR